MKTKYSIFDRLRFPDYDNPKQMKTGKLKFDAEKCKECGICITVCPAASLYTETTTKIDLVSGKAKGGKYGIPIVARVRKGATLCVACFDCGAACPHDAISIESNFDPKYHYKRLTQGSDMLYPKRY